MRNYRRFTRNYNYISKPMTNQLKKDTFKWTKETTLAFNRLK